MPESTLIVLTTLPDQASAERLAIQVLEQNLGACVNISGEITSVYRWKGQIQHGRELQIMIKKEQKYKNINRN